MKFKLNDEVKWSSSSNGVTKVKIGFIVEVIPPGVNVKKFELGRLLGKVRISGEILLG